MPIYDFQCEDCNKRFDELTSFDETGVFEGVKCPLCGSEKKTLLVTGKFGGFAFANPVGTDRWHSEDKGHDYRFKHNVPNVLAQREHAERNSHMGGTADIYGTGQADADINTDANWGEVK